MVEKAKTRHRGSQDAHRPSGHGPTYVKGANGRIVKSVYRCACHGREFETKAIMRMHLHQYLRAIRVDFAELVRTGNLGQPAWERLPGETPLQYSRFRSYLNSKSDRMQRSLDRTARVQGVEYKAVSITSSRWHWVLRADLWDRHVEAAEFREFETQKRQSARRQARLGSKLQELAGAAASSLLADPDRVAEMSGNEIAKLADVGTKIERLANSDPTAISEDRGQVKLIWEGPRPTWAPAPDVPEPPTIQGGPLTRQITGG